MHKHNPDINWRTGNIEFTRCPSECNVARAKKRRAKAFKYKASIEEDVDENDNFDDYTQEELIRQAIRRLEMKEEEEIREVKKEKEKKTAAEMVSLQFHVYLDRFKKKSSERFPTSKPWDHAIDLTDDSIPKKQKLYPLSPTETEEVGSFIDEQLQKGYIYQTFKVTNDLSGVLCTQERSEKTDVPRLSLS